MQHFALTLVMTEEDTRCPWAVAQMSRQKQQTWIPRFMLVPLTRTWRKIVDPESVLLPPDQRPDLERRPFTNVGPDYDDFVESTCRARLQEVIPVRRIATHRGKPLDGGAFAVPKDEKEDRFISDLPVNQLLDPRRLPRPTFAYIPRLRSVRTCKGKVLRISKRDARHYFHRLRIGRRWRQWLAHPRLHKQPGMVPVHRAIPMGFGPAAGFAQALTDVVTLRAELPPEKRVVPTALAPDALPVWGSIIDDVWALEEAGDGGEFFIGPQWLELVEREWRSAGVEAHPGKSENAVLDADIQGYRVAPHAHTVGVSVAKRLDLIQTLLYLLLDRRVVTVDWVERLVGKIGYCHSARAPLRSILEAAYRWLDDMRRIGGRAEGRVSPRRSFLRVAFLLHHAAAGRVLPEL